MFDHFQIAKASVAGRNHRSAGRNNQDALYCAADGERVAAVVCDGCGSGCHSEVGAGLGARLMVQALRDQPADGASVEVQLERVRQAVLARLLLLAGAMGGALETTLCDYFLFTVVGVFSTPVETAFFAIGDGVVIVNGELFTLGPFADNAPPYLAYGLWSQPARVREQPSLCFQILCLLPTAEVQSFVLGTDGVLDLMRAEARNLPGRDAVVGPVRRLWDDDTLFANPDALRRHLAAVNREITTMDRAHEALHREHGLLPDDTTLIVGRAHPQSSLSMTEGG